jgi:hypothetical protein
MNKKSYRANQKKSGKSFFSVSQIQVAKENDLLYEKFAIANADDLAPVMSIDELSIQEPLTLSADSFLLSGRRRFAAAKFIKLKEVLIRFNDTVFSELSTCKRLSELRSFNQQREKTPGKKICEQLLEIDPDAFYAQIEPEKLDARVVEAYRREVL